MLLADTLKSLCEQHDLTAISIGVHQFEWGASFNAYAHWNGAPAKCASSDADTPEEAIAKAVAEADAVRGRNVAIPEAIELSEIAA